MTVNFTNLGAFDYGTIVDQLVALKRTQVTAIQEKQQDLTTKGKLVDQLSSKLNTFQDSAETLMNMNDFMEYSAVSSDESKIKISSSGIAQPASFDVDVLALARSTKTYSTAQAAKDATGIFGSGTMDISIGGSVAGTVTVDGSSTMESIVEDINQLNIGVQASIFYDGSQYRILAVGKETGVANDVEFIENGTSIGLSNATAPYRDAAQDAQVLIDGTHTVTSSTNKFSGVVSGMTFEVLDETAVGESVSLRVDPDTDATADKVQEFVNAYNSVASFLTYQLSFTGTVKGPDTLFGDATARGIQSRLSGLVTSQVGGLPSDLSALSMIGIKTERDGTLSFDKTKFEEKIEADPQGVARLFASDDVLGTTGIAKTFYDTVEGYVNSTDGVLTAKKKGITTSVKRMDETIEAMERRIEQYESMLYKQFEAMNRVVSDLQYQGSYLTGLQTNN